MIVRIPFLAIAFATMALLGVAAPARAQSSADLLDRLQRLEAQVRTLNGQVEQLTFRNRQLEDQLKRTQGDLEFRINELEGARGGARPQGQRPPAQQPAQPQRQGRGDAFDPNAQASAPGAPRDLGGPTRGASTQTGVTSVAPAAGPLDLGQLAGQAANDPSLAPPEGGRPAGVGTQPQILSPSSRDEYDLAIGYLQRREFDQADIALRTFIRNYPRDRLVGDATYSLGESLYQRRQYREAAEQFLKVSTDYSRINRAPSSLLRLGQSLNALGEREAGCAAWAEVARRYPNAGQATRTAVEGEQRRARC
ncbi:MAG: tol-pal system protein YbgF [Alphaproteobacteria bacterium]